MTIREYLKQCDDFEKSVILANIARKYPDYDALSPRSKQQLLSKILDGEMPKTTK